MTATVSRARELAKGGAPESVVKLVRLRRDVWGDARLRLLAEVGGVPSPPVPELLVPPGRAQPRRPQLDPLAGRVLLAADHHDR